MILTLAQNIRIMNEAFGGMLFKNITTLHPLGLAMTLIFGILLLIVPRRYAVWPFIILTCFVSTAQRLVIGSLDINLVRLLDQIAAGHRRGAMKTALACLGLRPGDPQYWKAAVYAVSPRLVLTRIGKLG